MQDVQKMKSLYTVTTVVYLLQAIALFTAIPIIIGAIINYVKLDEVRGSWLESHFRWQLRTFWWGLLFYIIAIILHIILIGFIVGAIVWVWQVYRVIRGWIRLGHHQPMYTHGK